MLSRMRSASNIIKASFLADAATMPLHWIYNQNDIAQKIQSEPPAFFNPPSCPFYTYPAGVMSPYGDESIPLLRSISNSGEFDFAKSAESMFTFFKDYPNAETRGYVRRLNHAPKAFTEARDAGKEWNECAQDDSQANGIAKVPLIVARYAGQPCLLTKVEEMVRILQNTALAVSNSVLYAKVLEYIMLANDHPNKVLTSMLEDEAFQLTSYERHLLQFITSDSKLTEWVRFSDNLDAVELLEGESPFLKMKIKGSILTSYMENGGFLRETLSTATLSPPESAIFDRMSAPLSPRPVPVTEASESGITSDVDLSVNKVLNALGLSCALPGAFLGSLYIARKAVSYEDAINSNIIAGGDNCSRGMIIGALFGAYSIDAAAVLSTNVDGVVSEVVREICTEGEGLPEAWIQKVDPDLWTEICIHAEKIASENKDLSSSAL